MITCDFGDLVLVPFPFLDLSTKKRRPALVLSTVHPQKLPPFSIVAMVTSQLSGHLPGDCIVEDWKGADFLHPSKVRLSKIVSIENQLFFKKLGKLSQRDLRSCQKAFAEVFSSFLI